ncbi:MAG TPA: LacI family DNA-binding transcriptional regulator, partial [Candidatus Dormibacteraeota bacterium]|nr:LacI family DNA-binding transcriptional regulator [Candidatus Dormibacteraeota bacterium]
MPAATIADVARRAGVSTATVSRVLNRTGRASPGTRERVLEVARELGYRPSGIARSLKLRATSTLGLIVTDIENPYFPSLVRAVEDAARAEGYAILLGNASDDPDREAAYLDLFVERRVDGVVIAASSLGERQGEWLASPPLPVVLVNTTPAGVRLPAIASDNHAGARSGAEHLIGLGHRRIGFLAAPPSRNPDSATRIAGVRDAMSAAGLDPEGLAIATGAAVVGGGETAMAELLATRDRPTAVLAYNDLMAIGSLRAVRAMGLRCPDDVSVVGFDDLELTRYVQPALTTIAQDQARMGSLAVRALAALIRPGG